LTATRDQFSAGSYAHRSPGKTPSFSRPSGKEDRWSR
jgi:hypothetical protein